MKYMKLIYISTHTSPPSVSDIYLPEKVHFPKLINITKDTKIWRPCVYSIFDLKMDLPDQGND